jgi:membrane associated rhomboid family serine protease
VALAPHAAAWQMALIERRQVQMVERGGGILIALGLIVGAVIGIVAGNGALGMLGGLIAGVAAAWGLARRDARRK